MRVSTRGRYALFVMLDLARYKEDGFISLKDIAEREDMSMKYLEMIVGLLNKAGMVESHRGKNGGYKLNREPEEYTVGSILKLTEGSMAPVSCVDDKEGCCEKAGHCQTFPMWQELDRIIDDYLESVTLQDLLKSQ